MTAAQAPPERQDSRLSSEEEEGEENQSSSGSGSGAGYNADYESSESSLCSKQKNELQQQEGSINSNEKEKNESEGNFIMDTAVLKGRHKKNHHGGGAKKTTSEDSTTKSRSSSLDNTNHQLQALLPQWNGIRITHPMDPRIDLSTVGFTVNSNAAAPGAHIPIHMMATTSSHSPHAAAAAAATHNNNHSNSIDHYLGLMEAVRPFFGAYAPLANPLQGQQEASSAEAPNTGSSEGFTAFFTTTNSNSTNTNTSNSDSNSDPNAIRNRQARAASLQKGDETETSASSMVALARVKSKHKRRHEHGDASSSPSLSGGEKRPHYENNNSSGEQPLQQPQLNGDSHDQPQQQARRQQESTSSSSSSSEQEQQQEQQFQMPPPRPPPMNNIRAEMNVPQPLPLVSESSDAVRSNGFSSTSNATASGSGSNGNSGVSNKGSSGCGSGSNNGGSSGSGNEDKGVNGGGSNSNSEEHNKGDDGDEAVAAVSQQPTLGLEPEANDDGSTREDRLMDKKRKRLDKRREYEEQVQLDMNSSSSSDDQATSCFEPGKPVTLDTALSFSRMARIVIQAAPPFLVVHANAAFTRLTGVDSHEVNGRSISNLFTIPSTDCGGPPSHQAAAAAGRARAQDEMNVERLVVANGFDDYHVIDVAAKLMDVNDPNCDSVQCRMCVSPIVAQSMPPAEASAVVTDTNQESHHHANKKRKHHHHHQHEGPNALRHRKPAAQPTLLRTSPRNIITHYVIELQKLSPDDAKTTVLTSDGAALVNKLEQAQQFDQDMLENGADREESMEETSHSTDPKEPVEAVG